ncbi:MAG TPA: tail fiber domain-containing protein [Candidatus Udaeobacter sp.]
MKTTLFLLRHSMNLSPLRLALLLIPLVLACFALLPQARAVCQEGCDTINANTFLGDEALLNHSGVSNTAVGSSALKNNLNAGWNTAVGVEALLSNTIGHDNTAVGVGALEFNTVGTGNTATGSDALFGNTSASGNTATGSGALTFNRTGSGNVADGAGALNANTRGANNTATGYQALKSNTTANRNTASGFSALSGNTTGANNIGLGYEAGKNLTTGNNNIHIGNVGVAGESNTIRVGTTGTQTNAYIAGISGATVPTGIAVIVGADGHLGTITSSARYKEAIKPMDTASEAILALKPVTFRYKKDLDPDGIAQFGLVAEDVEKINPDLVARGDQGKPYSVRYEAVNAMLLNEFLKEHQTVQELKKQVAELTAGLQKVSAQLELSRPALQALVGNP